VNKNFWYVIKVIRDWYADELNITDDKIIMDNMENCSAGCRNSFDLAGAAVWDNLIKVFSIRDGDGKDKEFGDNLAFFLIMFGVSFHSIQNNLRDYIFWRQVFQVIVDQRSRFNDIMKKYKEGGEFFKNPDVHTIMMAASEKNVRILKSIFDKPGIFHPRVRNDDVFKDLTNMLEDNTVEDFEKAIIGFVHLYYLINRYGLTIQDDYIDELRKDADEWMLEACLTDKSLEFIKHLSGVMDNESEKGN